MIDAWPELLPRAGQDPLEASAAQSLRNVAWFRDNPLALFAEVARRAEGALGRFDLGVRPAALALNVDAAQAILSHPALDKELRPYGYAGTFRGFSVLRDLTGETLPYLDHARAKARRPWVIPAYPAAQRQLMFDIDNTGDSARLDALLAAHTQDGRTDLYRAFARFIFERLCTVLFGQSYADDAADIAAAVDEANLCLHQLCSRWWPKPMLALGPTAGRLREVRAQMERFSRRILRDLRDRLDRGEGPVPAFALCDFASLSDDEIRDEIVTQFIAGTESTSLAASWTAWRMMQHPTWWRRAHDDVTETDVAELRRGGLSRDGDLSRCLREGLRLFPSFWQYLRVAREDTCVMGQDVKKGTIHFVSPYLLQRDPRRYAQPDAFDPARSHVDNVSLTFGFGGRSCLGGRLAQGLITDVLRALLLHRPAPLAPAEAATEDGVRPLIFGLKRSAGFFVRLSPAPRTAGAASSGSAAQSLRWSGPAHTSVRSGAGTSPGSSPAR